MRHQFTLFNTEAATLTFILKSTARNLIIKNIYSLNFQDLGVKQW